MHRQCIASHVGTIIPDWPMRHIVWKARRDSNNTLQWAMGTAHSVQRNGHPGRADRVGNKACTGQRNLNTDTHLASILLPINSGPRPFSPPKSVMPAHRHPSTARSHAIGGPYKASIIVISSDEDEEPVSVPKRRSRKSRHSRVEGDILEIMDDTLVKTEEPELESLRRRCHDLEQAGSPPHCSMNRPNKRNPSLPDLLGARYAAE